MELNKIKIKINGNEPRKFRGFLLLKNLFLQSNGE